jgi:coproporphyrinogen III oxidase-like Fe-S oxidoreductase
LSIIQQERERVVFGLRLLDGVPIDWITKNTHDHVWAASLASLLEEGYIMQTPEYVALTVKGRQFADTVGRRLL